jgi:hypothetical protein
MSDVTRRRGVQEPIALVELAQRALAVLETGDDDHV